MSSKSLEELLAIINSTEDTVEHNLSEIEMFIKDMEIEASDTERVDARVIFWFYMKWKMAGNGFDPLPRVWFFREFNKRFKRGKSGNNRNYWIKKERFTISRWEKEEMQNDLQLERKEWQRRRQKRSVT